MFEFGYRKNEWVAVWNSADGERQVTPFDTYDEAEGFLKHKYYRVGVMTTSFYNRYVEKIAVENR